MAWSLVFVGYFILSKTLNASLHPQKLVVNVTERHRFTEQKKTQNFLPLSCTSLPGRDLKSQSVAQLESCRKRLTPSQLDAANPHTASLQTASRRLRLQKKHLTSKFLLPPISGFVTFHIRFLWVEVLAGEEVTMQIIWHHRRPSAAAWRRTVWTLFFNFAKI